MNKTQRQRLIGDFVVQNVGEHPNDIVRVTMQRSGVTRQTVINHIDRLVKAGLLTMTGRTKARRYALKVTTWSFALDIVPSLKEDRIWRENILPHLKDLPENVLTICNYGFTEMLNNVIDHSQSEKAAARIDQTALKTQISVGDFGVGIFNNIQRAFKLEDPRQALLELSKGKLTSDPDRHTGEGVFFTSRMFDEFIIMSGTVFFRRTNQLADEWLIEVRDQPETEGTVIVMNISNNSELQIQEIFDKYALADDDYGFSRTHIPIRLAMYEGEKMLSRSQAKRILARAERFREVILDFREVKEIGQAFADEIFRVFATQNPQVHIVPMFTTPEIDRMVARAQSGEIDGSAVTGQLPLLSLSSDQD